MENEADNTEANAPACGSSEHPQALALRTGYGRDDVLAAVSLPRCQVGHLHHDAGSLVLAWAGRCWITDPGYQQYRPGIEREYTLGPTAHNAPVIGGQSQDRWGAHLLALGDGDNGQQHAAVDLTEAYPSLPSGATVRREVLLAPGVHEAAAVVVVRDVLEGFAPGTPLRTSWQGGADLAWHFGDGWARLDDGERTLWATAKPKGIQASHLWRHEGTRGPLTLTHEIEITNTKMIQQWLLVCAERWDQPPRQETVDEVLAWAEVVGSLG